MNRRIFLASCLLFGCGCRTTPEPYSLIVVDLQKGFPAPRDSAFDHIIREIWLAIKANADIILARTVDCGDINPVILQECGDYTNVYMVEKERDDGSREVLSTLLRHRLNYSHIRVCGINTDICVFRTVRGLHEKLPSAKFEIIADACDSSYDHSRARALHVRGLALLSQLSRVRVQ